MTKREPKATKLTVTTLNKQAKVLEEQSEVNVFANTGEVFVLKIDRIFRATKSLDVVSEVITNLRKAQAENISIMPIFSSYVLFQIIKHFTSLGDSIPEDIETQIAIMNKLVDLDILEKIIEAMDVEQVETIYELIGETFDKMNQDVNDLNMKIEQVERAYAEGDIEALFDQKAENMTIEVEKED